jgi:hypothetical protein
MATSAPHRILTVLTIVVILGVAVIGALRYMNVRNLTGSILTTTLPNPTSGQPENFAYGTIDNAAGETIPANTHGIFTCPTTLPGNSTWLAPQALDTSGLQLRVYEYSTALTEKDDTLATSVRWAGKRYGFGQASSATLTQFSPNRTYYVAAAQNFNFRCFMTSAASSSVPPSSSSSSVPPPSSSSSSVPPSSSSSSSLEAGLISYWPIGEANDTPTSGTVAGDVVSAFDGVFTGNASWVSTPLAPGSTFALQVSPTSPNGYLYIGDRAELNFETTSDFSISAWVRPGTSSLDQTIISKFLSLGLTSQGWSVRYSSSQQRFYLQMVSPLIGTAPELKVKTTNTFAPNQTYHVVVTYNGSGPNSGHIGAVKIFVNNIDQALSADRDTLADNSIAINNIGGVIIGAQASTLYPFSGIIDDVKVYDHVITPAN